VALGAACAPARNTIRKTRRRLRVLTVTTRIGAAVAPSSVYGHHRGAGLVRSVVNLASATIFLLIPLLYWFGELVAPCCSSSSPIPR
jgi:adenylate cyclase